MEILFLNDIIFKNIKRKLFSFLLSLICLNIFAKEPLWYSSEDGLEEVYPNNTYIAEIGYGKNVQLAESDALTRISRFFNTSVSSKMETRELLISENDNFMNQN